ncbi:hypothetical protein KVR01_004591 [Diaporthe batatas]|uniref:uncharacterized protein n=1 Tax=Diaporthe batatas TaxID=748121 RepID=UPI001D0471AB|nr:uncharacterized protein KVR01_004591 [Diaporthe batatas]KAG8166039.1 hypothetical protein KVR01_004591 [Diaporthe batatas]
MESDKLTEGHDLQEAPAAEGSTRASSGENEPPAEPKEGCSALLHIPRAATICLLGFNWVLSLHNGVLHGERALLFSLLGSDASSRMQATYLISNTMSPILIWSAEANRTDLMLLESTALRLLALAAIPISGIERVAPIYYLYSMATWNSANLSDDRMIPSEAAKAVLPATLLCYVLPGALVSLVPLTATGVSLSHFNIESSSITAFFVAPLIVPCLTQMVSAVTRLAKRKAGKGGPRRKATPGDKMTHQTQAALDVSRSLRTAYAVSFAMQATQHLYTIVSSLIRAPRGQRSVVAVLSNLLTHQAIPRQMYSSLALYSAATLGFGLYTVWELRRRGLVSDKDAKKSAAGVIAGQVLFGPGATYAGLWWWRHGVLYKTRQLA